jgi:hypothetical protein
MKFSAYLCARLGLSADQRIRIVPSLLVNQVLSCEMKGTENLVGKQPGYTGKITARIFANPHYSIWNFH